jgi:hypothetical protein
MHILWTLPTRTSVACCSPDTGVRRSGAWAEQRRDGESERVRRWEHKRSLLTCSPSYSCSFFRPIRHNDRERAAPARALRIFIRPPNRSTRSPKRTSSGTFRPSGRPPTRPPGPLRSGWPAAPPKGAKPPRRRTKPRGWSYNTMPERAAGWVLKTRRPGSQTRLLIFSFSFFII